MPSYPAPPWWWPRMPTRAESAHDSTALPGRFFTPFRMTCWWGNDFVFPPPFGTGRFCPCWRPRQQEAVEGVLLPSYPAPPWLLARTPTTAEKAPDSTALPGRFFTPFRMTCWWRCFRQRWRFCPCWRPRQQEAVEGVLLPLYPAPPWWWPRMPTTAEKAPDSTALPGKFFTPFRMTRWWGDVFVFPPPFGTRRLCPCWRPRQ